MHRKSWVVSDMLCGEDLPGFVVGGETENYSIDFDDSAVEENIQNLSNSDSSSGDSIISENLNNISDIINNILRL